MIKKATKKNRTIGPWLIWEIHEIRRISWNPTNFMKSGGFHAWNLADFMHEIRRISWNLADFMHEIWQISWNLADFMKSSKFHETWRISCMKFGGFQALKSGRFHEIWQISYANCLICIWNPADFMADLEKCKLFYNAFNFFFYVNQISNSLAMGSPRLSLWPGAISSS